jgi:hypothetical protein
MEAATMTRYKKELPETWAEKECITDMITELNKIFDYAQIRKTTRGGYSLIVNGRSVMVIYDKTKIYDMVAAFLQGAYFMAEKETLNYC